MTSRLHEGVDAATPTSIDSHGIAHDDSRDDVPSTPILDVEEIVAGYGQLEILHGISLQVAPRELVAIIGPNGSGKSTLLKAVVGLVPIMSGTVRSRGKDITGLPPEDAVALGVSYVAQTNNVFPSLTIQENLEIGGYLRIEGLNDRIARMYELFPDLAKRKKSKARELSGGQRQMLAMGRALMLDPAVLLLDEPSAGLSPRLVDVVAEKIVEINRAGTAILLVEQSTEIALTISSRAYILVAGRNETTARSRELLENPDIGKLYLGQ